MPLLSTVGGFAEGACRVMLRLQEGGGEPDLKREGKTVVVGGWNDKSMQKERHAAPEPSNVIQGCRRICPIQLTHIVKYNAVFP